MEKNKLYVLCDKNLDLIYGAVQGGHCIYEFIKKFPNIWDNEYLIYLSTNLQKIKYELDFYNINYACFYEPDLDYKLTSIAVLNNDYLFKKIPLLK